MQRGGRFILVVAKEREKWRGVGEQNSNYLLKETKLKVILALHL